MCIVLEFMDFSVCFRIVSPPVSFADSPLVRGGLDKNLLFGKTVAGGVPPAYFTFRRKSVIVIVYSL